jgi:MerR family mercuric resistance operon transcriptional regulator
MSTEYTIGRLAAAADIPTSTVRYYERIGLLTPNDRSEGNYRLYSEESLERLRFIRAAHAAGFTLDDVATLLGLRVAANAPCEDVQLLMEQRLAEVKSRMDELRHVERVLKSFLKKCRQTSRKGHCAVLDKLNAASFATTRKSSRGKKS